MSTSVRDKDPLSTYRGRLASWKDVTASLTRLDRWIGSFRLLVAVVGIAVAWMAWSAEWLSPWSVLAPVLLFLMLLYHHWGVRQRRARSRRAEAFFEEGLARLEDRWAREEASGAELDRKSVV